MSFMYETFLNDTKLLMFVLLFFSIAFTVFVTVNIIIKLKNNKLIYPYIIYQFIVFFIQFLAIINLFSSPDMFIVLTKIINILSVYLGSLFLILVFSLILEKTPSLPFMLSMIAFPFIVMNLIIIEPSLLFVSTGDFKVTYELLYLLQGVYKYAIAIISVIVVFVFIYRIKGKIVLKDLLLSLLILLPIAFDIISRFFFNGEFDEITYFLLFTMQIILLYTISQKWTFKLLNNIQRNTLDLISDGILIMNRYGIIIYSNHNGILSDLTEVVTENNLISQLKLKISDFNSCIFSEKISMIKGNRQCEFKTKDNIYYLCNVNGLEGDRNSNVGVIVSLIDITEYQLLIEALKEKNINLDKANKELEDQEKIISDINKMKKEEKISQDIRDLLANTMTQILTSLKASEILLHSDQKKAKTSLIDVMNLAKDYLVRVRKMVSSLKESKEN